MYYIKKTLTVKHVTENVKYPFHLLSPDFCKFLSGLLDSKNSRGTIAHFIIAVVQKVEAFNTILGNVLGTSVIFLLDMHMDIKRYKALTVL